MWCNERLLVDVIGPKGVVSSALEQPFARVGSHPESDVVLADGPLNGRSLYLHAVPGGLYCVDLRRVQGDSTDVGLWLKPTDEVGIGRYWLRACLQGPLARETAKVRLDQDESATYPRPVLNVLSGKRSVAKKRLHASLSTVGRWPQCGLHLQGHLVSGVHCAFYWHDRRLWCIDLLSSNRTLHQKQPVTCVELSMGDRVEVGEFEIVFERFSRQKDVTKQKSWQPQPTASSSDSPRKGNFRSSRRKAWRETESGIADSSSSDSSSSGIPGGTLPRRGADADELITASDSAITIEPTINPEHATLHRSANEVDQSATPQTGHPPEVQQLEELSRKLHGQFAQIQAEANHLTELTQRLNLASTQWAENRAEILEILTTSLNLPSLAGIARPPEPAPNALIANGETSAPKLIAPVTAPVTATERIATESKASSTAIVVTTAPGGSTTGDAGEASPPRLLSPGSEPTHEPKNAAEPPKEPDPAVTRPLPHGRPASRNTVNRNELVDFVSDRIALIERQRRRKNFLIGLGVAVAILLLIGMIGGLWYRFGQDSFRQPIVQWLQPGSSNP